MSVEATGQWRQETGRLSVVKHVGDIGAVGYGPNRFAVVTGLI